MSLTVIDDSDTVYNCDNIFVCGDNNNSNGLVDNVDSCDVVISSNNLHTDGPIISHSKQTDERCT